MAACDRINGSRALLPRNKRFRPHPPELVDEVRAGLNKTRARIHAIERVLNAKVLKAEPERAPLSPEDIQKLIDTALGRMREGDDRPPNEKAIEEQKRSTANRERTEALAHLARRKAEVDAEIAAEQAAAVLAAQHAKQAPQQPN
jgi:spore cortex formation protein SpoVR/YcgB (stage V sporulation)